jgi:hypothetical protein
MSMLTWMRVTVVDVYAEKYRQGGCKEDYLRGKEVGAKSSTAKLTR